MRDEQKLSFLSEILCCLNNNLADRVLVLFLTDKGVHFLMLPCHNVICNFVLIPDTLFTFSKLVLTMLRLVIIVKYGSTWFNTPPKLATVMLLSKHERE